MVALVALAENDGVLLDVLVIHPLEQITPHVVCHFVEKIHTFEGVAQKRHVFVGAQRCWQMCDVYNSIYFLLVNVKT